MKRYAILPVLLVAASVLSSAQVVRGWGIEGGLAGGYQLLSVTLGTNSPVVPRVPRWGFTAGAFIEFLNTPNLSFVVESAYSQKGRDVTAEEVSIAAGLPGALSPGPVGSAPRLDYVRLTMLVKVRFWKEGFVPYFGLGPRFDFLVGKRDGPVHVFDQVKKTDVGVSVTGGIEITPKRRPLASIEARWSPAFTRVVTAPTLTVRNQAIEFLLAIWL